MANKAAGKSKVNHYATYKSSKRWESNRTKRLERTIRNQPNNLQAQAALKAGFVYRRKTPTTRMWSASWIRIAKLYKEFTGSFNPDLMSANKDVVFAANAVPGRKTRANAQRKVKDPINYKDFFTLGARLQGVK